MSSKTPSRRSAVPGGFPTWLRDSLVIVVALACGLGAGHLLTKWAEQSDAETTRQAREVEEAVKDGEIAGVDPEESFLEGTAARLESSRGKDMTEAELEKSEKAQPILADISPGDDAVILDPPTEMNGGLGDPDDRTSDAEHAPEAAIENCSAFFTGQFGEDFRLKEREGPVRAGFEVEFEGVVSPWSLMTVSQLPGEVFHIVVVKDSEEDADRQFVMEADEGEVAKGEGFSLSWEAPEEAGIYCVRVLEKNTDNIMCFHVAVLRTWDGESEYLNGYRIGKYQDKPFRDNPRYKKPRGFIEVTEENEDTWISPHLQLSQFVCKQKSDFPKYMLVDSLLLLKLEAVIEDLKKSGRDADNLYITSGFRTPAYNEAIGNATSYSRHLYGDAADLFVDSLGDGRIDDLDFDGSVGDGDAKVIQRSIQSVTDSHRYLKGGLGFYSSARYRNPFIHIDTRGYSARWSK
ncbi:MAG: D-Ala-D-Ala carboxypeptidase family metallohydrolase [Verrucomicrobiales bacterium]